MHPVIFTIGSFELRFYGLMYVIAIIIGSFLLRSEVRRKGIALSDDETLNFLMWVIIGGIVGARIYYVIFNLGYYMDYPVEIPAVWHGGLAIHGGIIGGLVAGVIYLKRKSVSFWPMADACAPVLIQGQCFGRIGNFMNGDAHGMPTDMPWGIVFSAESIAGREFPGIPLHPTMLYELILNFSIFLFLWLFMRKREYKSGFVFALYIALYSGGRFFVEIFRADSLMIGPLKTAQVISIALVLGAVLVILTKKLYFRKAEEA
ncbi:MAG: prolipoprotein diacylglyceryl transferase [Deltaproteobacteria bacterium]|nr:prolipoprotein diacylglyceryl transferase [Deltaproteobacteria bacterium]